MMRLFFERRLRLLGFSTSRDCATKALICILIDRINLVLELLQKFKKIDERTIKTNIKSLFVHLVKLDQSLKQHMFYLRP